MNELKKVFDIGIKVFLFVFSFLALASSLLYSYINNVKHYSIFIFLFEVILTSILFLIVIFVWKVKNLKIKKNFFYIILLIGLFTRVVWLLSFNTQPVEDFKVLVDSANSYLNGDKDIYNKTFYFFQYPYQIFFSLYEMLVLKFFSSFRTIKFLNLFYLSIIPFIILIIYRKNRELKEKLLILCFLSFYGPFIWYSSIMSNQQIAIFFIICSFFFYYYKKNLFIVGSLLALSQFMRPTGKIVVLAYIVNLIVFKLDKNSISYYLKKLFQLVLGYKGVIYLITILIFYLGVYKFNLDTQPRKYAKFYIGTNDYYGILNEKDDLYVHNILKQNNLKIESNAVNIRKIRDEYIAAYKKINQLELEEIKSRIFNKNILKKIGEKFVVFWGGYDLGIVYTLKGIHNEKGHINLILRIIEKVGYNLILMIFIFFNLQSLLSIKEKTTNKFDNLYELILIGYILVYLMIEIQTRYRFELIYFIILVCWKRMIDINEKK